GGGTRVLRNVAQRALSLRGHRPDRCEAPRADHRGGRRPRADREDDPRLRLLSAPVVEDLEEGAAAEFLERQSGGERLLLLERAAIDAAEEEVEQPDRKSVV